MTRDQLIKNIAKELSVDELAVAEFVDAIFDTLILTFLKGKNVTITELGKFRIQKKREGEYITKRLIFTPVKKLSDQINKNYNNLPIVKLRIVDFKSKDSIPEVGEKEFIYIMEDEVIISSDMFEEGEIESTSPSVLDSKMPSNTIQEKDYLRNTTTTLTMSEENLDTVMGTTSITGTESPTEMLTEDKEFPTIEETPSSDTDKEPEPTTFELKEVVAERQKLIDEITELEKKEKELDSLSILEKLSQYNVDNFDIAEKTQLDNNELIAIIGKEQNIFFVKEDTTTQQSFPITSTDTPFTSMEDEISEELKTLEEEISNLPSIGIPYETKAAQPLKESDTSTKVETGESFDDSIKSLQDAFEEIQSNKPSEEKPSSTINSQTKEAEGSSFKSIDYIPPQSQEELEPQTGITKPLNEISGERKVLNPYLKLTIIFLLIFLLLFLIAILF